MISLKDTIDILKGQENSPGQYSKTLIMGILNITMDSFYDGGLHFQKDEALRHALEMVKNYADIIDIGGESTRPFSDPIPVDEELKRVIPVISALSRETETPISIDTYKSEVARQAIEAGATIVNDISALRFDPSMAALIAKMGVPVVLMHMKGTPKNMQENPVYEDLINEIIEFFTNTIDRAVETGIKLENIIIDPGIGFGKSINDNLMIIKELNRFSSLGQQILIGSSNKSFIGHILSPLTESRQMGTMATIAASIMNGANIVRVHDVKAAREIATIIDSIKAGNAMNFKLQPST